MTSCTRSARVFRVIESDVETLQRRKRFHLSALRVCMTDRAHPTRRICELLRVTTRARRMRSFARQRRLRGVVFTTVTKQTGKPRVVLIVVFELRVRSFGHHKAQKAQNDFTNTFVPFVLFCGNHDRHFAGL